MQPEVHASVGLMVIVQGNDAKCAAEEETKSSKQGENVLWLR